MSNHFIDTKKRYQALTKDRLVKTTRITEGGHIIVQQTMLMKRHKARLLRDVAFYEKILTVGTEVYLDLGPGSCTFLETNPTIAVSTNFIMYPRISVPISFLEELDGSPLIVKELGDESDT